MAEDLRATPTAGEDEKSWRSVEAQDPVQPNLPRDWPVWKKRTNLALVCALTFLVNISATMSSPGVTSMMAEFKETSKPLGTFSVSVYILGLALGPMIFAPLSEIYGRLRLYHWTNAGFIYFTVLCGIAFYLPLLIVLRFFQGCVASVPVVIGGGTISDLYSPETRGRATSIYFVGALMGPPLGPIAGAFITEYLSWRWTFVVTALAGVFLSILCVFLLRETHEKTVLRKLAEKSKSNKKSGIPKFPWKLKLDAKSAQALRVALMRPMSLVLHDRAVLLLGIYQAAAYGVILLQLTTFSSVFSEQYQFSTSVSGLPYIGIAVGFLVGIVISSSLSDRLASSLARKNNNQRKPEFRLPIMIWTCWLIPLSLATYGWAAFYKLHFMIPIAAASISAVGLQFIMLNLQVYLSEAYTGYVPSAIAAVTLLRCLLGSVLPVIGETLYETLGLGWGNSVLAFLSLALMPIPWVVMKFFSKE